MREMVHLYYSQLDVQHKCQISIWIFLVAFRKFTGFYWFKFRNEMMQFILTVFEALIKKISRPSH